MKADKHHLQIRLSSQLRKELRGVSGKLGLSAADVVRSALFFGLPMLLAMNDLQGELIQRLVKKVKAEARLRQSHSNGR